MRSDSGSSQKPTTECDVAPSSASYSTTCSLSTTESSTVLAKARTLSLAEVSLQDDRKQCTGDDFAFNLKKTFWMSCKTLKSDKAQA